jgi:decaprenylphospho-beta-D-erythro-pentofuranosid-2-ulose 2-reductase
LAQGNGVTESDTPQKVLVLGATSAIAIATMRIYAGRGAAFYLVARSEEKLRIVASDLQVRGASAAHTCVLDLDDTSRHEPMLRDADEQLHGYDVALIAHGVLGEQSAAEQDYGTAEQVFRTNLLSAVSLITWLANYFAARQRGTIAVISSVAGDRGRKLNYVYGASKAGLSAFLQGVRNRVDRLGVHVLTMKPGFVSTPMTAHMQGGILFATPERVARGIVHAIDHRKDVVYLPGFWRLIMGIVKSIPEPIFKRLNL